MRGPSSSRNHTGSLASWRWVLPMDPRVLPTSLALVLAACGGSVPTADPAPTVATAEIVRGEMSLTREGTTEIVTGRARVETGATVATGADGRGALSLDSGAWVLVDRSASLVLELGRAQLDGGRIWIEEEPDFPTVFVVDLGGSAPG